MSYWIRHAEGLEVNVKYENKKRVRIELLTRLEEGGCLLLLRATGPTTVRTVMPWWVYNFNLMRLSKKVLRAVVDLKCSKRKTCFKIIISCTVG